MNLLAIVDQILNQPQAAEPGSVEKNYLLGLPSSLTGIDLKAVHAYLAQHRKAMQEKLGRDVHPAAALLDLVDVNQELGTTIEDFCLLKKTALRDLINAAIYDNLTGLYSRNILETRLQEEFRRARRYDVPLSVLFIETDAFKEINDTYGHLEGDRALAFIGRFIQNHVREVDFPARYGGDEFMVILPHTGGETALGLAHRIHSDIGEAQKNAGLRVRITISIGVGTLTPKMKNAENLIEAADRATYKAKTNKNMVWPTVNAEPQEDSRPAAKL